MSLSPRCSGPQLIHGFLRPPRYTSKRHVGRFCMAHGFLTIRHTQNTQTQRLIDHVIGNNRPPHLAVRSGLFTIMAVKQLWCDTDVTATKPVNHQVTSQHCHIFTARCYASAVLAMALCPSISVRLSVRPSQVGVLLKRLNVGSHRQHHTIPQRLY